MASPPISNALDVPTRSTPILTAAEISRVRPFGKLRQVEKGEILYEPGDTNVPFFILVSGSMEILQPDISGGRSVATRGPGMFTGEITMISGRRSIVRGRVTQAGEFIELSADGLRLLVARDAELSEIFMRAFLLPPGAHRSWPGGCNIGGLAPLGQHAQAPGVSEPQRASLYVRRS